MQNIDYDKIYSSNNYGQFKCIREIKNNKSKERLIEVEFIKTGTIDIFPLERIKRGNIKDKYFPKYFGVACISNATCYNIAYGIWSRMINRCYNINNKDYYNYGAKGVHVCAKWLCFEYFLKDLPYIDNYSLWVKNPNLYHLDKDYKQRNSATVNKVYSLETCCFLHRCDNIALSDINNKYIGLEYLPNGKIRVRPVINGIKHYVGTFEDPIIAANAYNNFIKSNFGNDRIVLNDVPYMPSNEVIKYNLKKDKIICKRID